MICNNSIQEAKYSGVEVDVKCTDGKEIKKPAGSTNKMTQPLLTDEDADVVIRSDSQ